jgi:hypothetical protein
MPDRRARQGKRDLALLHLLGSAACGVPKPPACSLAGSTSAAAQATRRLRQAIARSTSW